ncbi:bombesin receptor subtype-3-like [Saccoglossus kowalevskii]
MIYANTDMNFTNYSQNMTNDVQGTDSKSPFFYCGVAGTSYFIGAVIISSIGLLLNAAFVFVFCRVRYMRTLTNGYLVNLAVSDMSLLFTVILVFVIVLGKNKLSAELNCAVNLIQTTLLYVSLWMVTIVSIERYLGICNPLKARLFNTQGRVVTLIALTWILAFVCATPRLLSCTMLSDPEQQLQTEYAMYSMYSLMFFASSVTVATMYALTVKTFRKSIRAMRNDRKQSRKSDEKQVLITCMAISVIFFVCMLPSCYKYVNLFFWRLSGTAQPYGGKFTVCVYAISKVLLLINSSVNPLIYTITSARCRRAFLIAFFCRKETNKRATIRYSTGYACGNSVTTNIDTEL